MSEKDVKVVEETTKEKATTKKTTTKATAPKATATKKVEDKKEESVKEIKVVEDKGKDLELENIKQENEALRKQIEELMALAKASIQASVQPTTIVQSQEKTYKVIHLLSDDNVCELKTSKGVIRLSGYEDFVEVDEIQFRDIARNYHNLFAIGFLTTDSEGAKILAQRKINVAHRWLTNDEIYNLDTFTEEELIDLYKTLHPRQKDKLIEVFLEGVNEGKKEGFLNKDKLFALSKAYDGYEYRKRIDNAIIKVSQS